jgi:hypothetical protein
MICVFKSRLHILHIIIVMKQHTVKVTACSAGWSGWPGPSSCDAHLEPLVTVISHLISYNSDIICDIGYIIGRLYTQVNYEITLRYHRCQSSYHTMISLMITQFTDYDITFDITIIWNHSLTMISHLISYMILFNISSDVVPYHMWYHMWHHIVISHCDIIDKKLWYHMWYHRVPRGTSDVISFSWAAGPGSCRVATAIAGCSSLLDTDCSEDVFTPRGGAALHPAQAGPGAPAPLRASRLRWWRCGSVTTFSLISYRTLCLNLPAEQQTFSIENPAHKQTSRGMCCQGFVQKGPCAHMISCASVGWTFVPPVTRSTVA